jgi:alkylation response protein AidB-like acyl-CoA dehydrogenase
VDFADTPAEAAFRAEARGWLEANARPREGDWAHAAPTAVDRAAEAAYLERCRDWQRTLFDGGWAGVTWPEAFGGRGGTPMQNVIFRQEQANYAVTSGFIGAICDLAGPALLAHGSDEQRGRWMRPMLRGDEVWCQLFSEPAAGSDLAALRTRAVRDGDEWVVNGQKVWTSGAHHADHAILLARTDPDAPKHKGITFFVADMHDPGIDIRPLRQINGAAHFNEVFLTDVRVPHADVVGEVNAGWGVVRTTLASESATIGGGRAGLGDVADLVRLARATGTAGDPVVRQRLADLHVRAEVLRFLQYRVLTAISRGTRPGPAEAAAPPTAAAGAGARAGDQRMLGSVLKLVFCDLGSRMADVGVALGGPAGALLAPDAPAEASWQHLFLRQFSFRIGGGTEQVHRNMIGEAALGLPREPQVDKDVPFRELVAS